MTVTIKDIAERAGVSFSTVSKALRGSSLVQERTKKHIIEIAEQMGYVPNIAARKLVINKSGSFGVIWPTVEQSTPSLLITKINDYLEEKGYTMLFSINRFESAIEAFNRFRVDAILVFYDRDQPLHLEHKWSTSIPILYFGQAGMTPYPTVDTMRGKSIALAVRHLAGLGHQRLAYIGGLTYEHLLQREKTDAFVEEAKQLGVEGTVIPISGLESHDGYLAAKQALQGGFAPTGIVGGSYDLSRGILRAAMELGIRVPRDLSIVGYDHTPDMEKLDVPLTAVGASVSHIARSIAQGLIDLSEDKKLPETIELEPHLMLRSSSASPGQGGVTEPEEEKDSRNETTSP